MDFKKLGVVLHPDWGVFEDFLKEERGRYVSSLINSSDHDESMSLRGRIKELDTLLRLPEQVKSARGK